MKSIISSLLFLLLLCTACDDGRIYEKEYVPIESGRVAKVEMDIDGVSSWPSNYTVAIAGFSADNQYASITRNVQPDANGHVSMKLVGIPDEVKTIEVCVTNSLRRRIITFYSADAPTTSDTIRISAGSLNVGMYAAIQSAVLNKECANCHSGNAWAASLNLTEGHSYADMVNVTSHKDPSKLRVLPSDADNSILYEALATDISTTWKHDHSKIMITKQPELQMIKDWINNGAKE